MSSILVRTSSSEGGSTTVELAAGDRLTFGRGSPGLAVGMPLMHSGVSRFAGEITAGPRYWYLANTSPRTTYVVENVEGYGEFIRVGPGRVGVPVPFEISRVVIPAGNGRVTFEVFAPAQPVLAQEATELAPGTSTTATFPLDRSAKYFLVLVALCEPRLRGVLLAPPPTDRQVVGRLHRVPGCENLTARAVAFHIDYVARNKLHLRGDGTDPSSGSVVSRESLVAFALKFGLVREEHLSLLPDRRRAPVSRQGTA